MPYTPRDIKAQRETLRRVDADARFAYKVKSAIISLWELWDNHRLMVGVAAFLLWIVGIVLFMYEWQLSLFFMGASTTTMVLLSVEKAYMVGSTLMLSCFAFILYAALVASHLTAVGLSAGVILLLLNGIYRYARAN
jgi:hypothetical protein